MINNLKNKNYFFLLKTFFIFTLSFIFSFIVLNPGKKFCQSLEYENLNSKNDFLTEKNNLKTKDIVLVLFDDKTKFSLRENGLPITNFEEQGRHIIKSLIENLEANNIKAIGINLNLSNSTNSKVDDELSAIIKKHKNIVIADSLYSFKMYKANDILSSATRTGYGELFAEYDNVVHKVKLTDKDFKNASAFSYELFKSLNNNSSINLNEIYLRYPRKKFKTYSIVDLINGSEKYSSLTGKVVILGIGLKSKLIKDQLSDPFENDLIDSEVQAITLANVMQKKYLINNNILSKQKIIFISALIFGLIFSIISPNVGLILFLSLLVSLLILNQGLYSVQNINLEIIPFLIILVLSYLSGTFIYLQIKLLQKNKEQSLTLLELNKKIDELKDVRLQLSHRSEDERKRIARELHDDTLARITDLRRYIELIINDSMPNSLKNHLESSIKTLTSVTKEIRRIINALRPSMLDNALGLIPAIENLLDELKKRSNEKIQIKFICNLDKLDIDESSEIHLYRIIQEALNNIYKHSKASEVIIKIEKQPGQILILISDNGVGIQEKNSGGFGFIDMKERAELIGAKINYVNKPANTGTSIEIIIPIFSTSNKMLVI